MSNICDLHTHSIFSDGTFTPSEIITKAIEIGLAAVALCDHNTVDGIPEFLSAAKNKDIKAIAGAEFSVDYNGTELHLLGLYLPTDTLKKISDLMSDVNRKKAESNIALIDSLNKAGYDISYSDIKKKTPNGKFNRAHIAAELTLKGYTESTKQAFDTVLSKEAGHYIEPERLNVFDMIEFIKDIGAIAVLAHPFLNLTEKELLEFLPLAKEKGLVGMECYYPLYDKALVDKSVKTAEQFGLKKSGGSDFHGTNKADIKLGFGKDNLNISYECARELEAYKKSAE